MNFDFGKLDIMEAFLPRDALALVELVGRISHKDMVIAEVGSWKGYSTAWLAGCIQQYGGMLYAIDHWKGNEGTWNAQVACSQDIYKIFEYNLRTLNLWEFIKPMVMDSQVACETFADQSIDLVFLDADHRYKQFKTDLEKWWPKVKVGGIICGHDCEIHYRDLPEIQRVPLESELHKDFMSGYKLHPGVVKGLYEFFDDTYTIMFNSTVWYKQNG